jgi:8-oxo-dGTP pyrophosphatase MutT (NUDIX family)
MALTFDPQALPLSPLTRQPAVSTAALTAEAIRARFAAPPAWEPEVRADPRFSDKPPRDAAVLIALVQRTHGLQVLLTQRTDHLHDHAGQISFAGGRRDAGDANAAATALREAQEEIGLAAQHIELLGELPLYTTGTAYHVTPVVALVNPPFTLKLDTFEVAEAFEVPLAFLMNPKNHEQRYVELGATRREFFAMPYEAEGKRYFIWGATAAMLRNFYRGIAKLTTP